MALLPEWIFVRSERLLFNGPFLGGFFKPARDDKRDDALFLLNLQIILK